MYAGPRHSWDFRIVRESFPFVSEIEIECSGSVVQTMVADVLQPWRGDETLLNPFELDSGLLEQLEGSSQGCIGCAAPLGWAVKSASRQSSMSSAVRVSVEGGSTGRQRVRGSEGGSSHCSPKNARGARESRGSRL